MVRGLAKQVATKAQIDFTGISGQIVHQSHFLLQKRFGVSHTPSIP